MKMFASASVAVKRYCSPPGKLRTIPITGYPCDRETHSKEDQRDEALVEEVVMHRPREKARARCPRPQMNAMNAKSSRNR